MNVTEMRDISYQTRIQRETRANQSEIHTDIKMLQIYQLTYVAIQP